MVGFSGGGGGFFLFFFRHSTLEQPDEFSARARSRTLYFLLMPHSRCTLTIRTLFSYTAAACALCLHVILCTRCAPVLCCSRRRSSIQPLHPVAFLPADWAPEYDVRRTSYLTS